MISKMLYLKETLNLYIKTQFVKNLLLEEIFNDNVQREISSKKKSINTPNYFRKYFLSLLKYYKNTIHV